LSEDGWLLHLYKDNKRKDYDNNNDKKELLLILYSNEGAFAHITTGTIKARTNS
jgi:hypothetical protein